jgi:hypothetical protein
VAGRFAPPVGGADGTGEPVLTSDAARARLLRPPLPVVVAAGCALLAVLVVELAPVVGGDLVAQAWWASWAASGGRPVDLGWYGGVPIASYSLLGPWFGAALGLPLVGAVGTVVGAAATTALLGRLRPSAARWTAAGVAAALTWAADEWSGRTTFGLGAALGCLALLVASGSRRRTAVVLASLLAVVAGAVSPLASAFLLLAVAAWALGSLRRPFSLHDVPAAAWWLGAAALVPLVVARLLGAVAGPEPSGTQQMLGCVAVTALTAALVGRGHRVVQIGLALTALVLTATWLIEEPVGSNSTRLVLLFAVPLLVAGARTPSPVTAVACAGVVWLVPPLVPGDFGPRDPAVEARADGLLAELDRLAPVGRVEVVPLQGHEESLVVGARVPVARGWLRQLDTARAPLFYNGDPGVDEYVAWLRASGVSYVALPRGELDWSAHGEAALLRDGVPGLEAVWSDASWTLFRVPGGTMVRGAELVASDRSAVVVDVATPGRVDVAVHWSRWASVGGPAGCLRPGGPDGWTILEARRPGRYVISSAWRPSGHCR